jgi:hypothetical protein
VAVAIRAGAANRTRPSASTKRSSAEPAELLVVDVVGERPPADVGEQPLVE